ncbi:hypothetical protein OG943_11415 [Amycolatopsis sp. NBC_00345]|uniref:hypothetical protein n=1 Tax=Amycolatopsis sp. NBC_00345 TaxID=2975955 RepID=UPI002E25F2E5
MARTEPGDNSDNSDLDSVAKLVSLSMTAPMPRISGEEPPLVATGGPAEPSTRPQPAVGQLPAELDALMGAPEPGGRAATAPPETGRRPARRFVIAGAAVVALAGLGTWALWPAPVNGTAGKPAEVPAAPSSSTAPPAIATMSASPEPPAASDEVSHTTVRTTEARRAPSKAPGGGAPASKTTSDDPLADYFSSAVNSYIQQWSDQQGPPRRH